MSMIRLFRTFCFSATLFALTALPLSGQDTFSIVAVDPSTGEVGSAGASCLDNIGFPGSNGAIIISDILPGRGAIHTQSYWNATNQTNARIKMLEGLSPAEIIVWLKQNDAGGVLGSITRQYGIVDFDSLGAPRSAAHTGNSCLDWKGHRLGPNYSIQGNILLGPQILDSMEARFLRTEGLPLATRLMYSLQGANVAGADTRCMANGTSSLSAFVRMALPSDSIGHYYMDLNVPSLPAGQEPIDSLQTLFGQWAALHTIEPEFSRLQVFPNPSNGSFSLVWPQNHDGTLILADVLGTELKHWKLATGTNQFAVDAPDGMYFLIAKSNSAPKQYLTAKLLVQH